jgi:glycosyltransferase involved in cell wall biosynthesis
MIVKDEAHCIERCLNSVKPYIDYWVICDTGSTDGTQDVIKNYLKDIPGELHQKEWSDFSTNRNHALELSKDKAEYSIVIDADDYLVVDDKNCLKDLKYPCYFINFEHGPVRYNRIQLFKNDLGAKYIGVLHEFLSVPDEAHKQILNGCYIKYGANGARWKDPQKYFKDSQVFEKELLKDPNNSRNIFYCAQSYRDAGILDKALEKYIHRANVGGWIEETYMALLNAARITKTLHYSDIIKVQNIYLRAHNCLPSRVEALCDLCSYLREHKLFELAYFYAKIGMSIPKPKDGLFLEPACYDWRILDELSIASFYIHKMQEYKEYMKLLSNNIHVPESEKNRIFENLKFI